jgi:deoxyribodipyrimidine photo-lyase
MAPVIIWFRQDLRLKDQPALAAAAAAGPVIPVFILDDVSPGAWKLGGASRWWLHHSLASLAQNLPLLLRRGEPTEVLRNIIAESGARALYFTRDYAPWAPALETRVKSMCDELGVACHRHSGFLLHEPESIRTGGGQFYKVYTPFSRACFAQGSPRAPRPHPNFSHWTGPLAGDSLAQWHLLPQAPDWAKGFADHWQPGEAGARHRLQDFIAHGLKGYADGRDRPDQRFTSRLSAHLHWGEISPRQVWHAIEAARDAAGGGLDRDAEKYLKELLWREFSYHLLYNVPSLPETPFRPEFAGFPWAVDDVALKRWQRGETGYPIVDAGQRELWATGTMHNRVRMIAASFLIKHLLIPWQEGERWFWDTLVDADIASNAASWQWVAGCGADAAPYFRIFNPVLQGEKFDPHGAYVKRWVPELAELPDNLVHRPWEAEQPPKDYPLPMVDHGLARDRALAAFKAITRHETT